VSRIVAESFCSSCAETGYTTEVGCDYPGNYIWSNHGSTASYTSCLIKCDKTDSCVTAMWNKSSQKCDTKHGDSEKKCDNPSNTVGRSCEKVPECLPPMEDQCTKVNSQAKESNAFVNCGDSISNDCYFKDGDNFIDFRGWENQKKYNFELRYASSSDNSVVTWTQTENPFSIYDSTATVTNLSVTLNEENYTYKNDNLFTGLSVSSSSSTLLDGNVGSWWFYSVGNNKFHQEPNVEEMPKNKSYQKRKKM
jgi:hypothetical protein